MAYRYYAGGRAMAACADDYQPGDGEAVFADAPSEAELEQAFPGYGAALLEDARRAKGMELNADCQAAIVGGFASDALGAVHTYPSQPLDQQNLAANVLSSLLPGVDENWTTLQLCADADGAWAYRAHTAAQIQAVGAAGKTAILALLVRNGQLKAALDAAETRAAIEAIAWSV